MRQRKIRQLEQPTNQCVRHFHSLKKAGLRVGEHVAQTTAFFWPCPSSFFRPSGVFGSSKKQKQSRCTPEGSFSMWSYHLGFTVYNMNIKKKFPGTSVRQSWLCRLCFLRVCNSYCSHQKCGPNMSRFGGCFFCGHCYDLIF